MVVIGLNGSVTSPFQLTKSQQSSLGIASRLAYPAAHDFVYGNVVISWLFNLILPLPYGLTSTVSGWVPGQPASTGFTEINGIMRLNIRMLAIKHSATVLNKLLFTMFYS
jgi:hypothetical protein